MREKRIVWRRVRGSQDERPEAIDKTSSDVYVYLRRNIHRVAVPQDRGLPVLLWEYEEAAVTYADYAKYDTIATELLQAEIADQEEAQRVIKANVSTIAALTDVDLDSPDPSRGLSLKERIDDLETALCELLDILA